MSDFNFRPKTLNLLRNDYLYIFLLLALILFNLLSVPSKEAETEGQPFTIGSKIAGFEYSAESFEQKMRANPRFEIFVRYFLLFLAVALFFGLLIDILLIVWTFPDKWGFKPKPSTMEVHWSLGDIVRVFILIASLIYLSVLIQNIILKVLDLEKTQNFRLLFTTSAMDIFAFLLVLYFVLYKRGQSLRALGLVRTRFFSNVVIGFIGYLCALPIFLFVIFVIMLAVNLMGYSPSEQQIITMFIRQNNPVILAYMIFLTLLLGPIIEEIFFRGFVYPVLKKKVGVPMAIFLTSCLFSLLHFKLIVFIPIFVLGIILAYVYEKTNSLVAPITLHIIHNSAMLTFLFIVKQFI